MRARRRRLARKRKRSERKYQQWYCQKVQTLGHNWEANDEWDEDEFDDHDPDRNCHYCGGEGYGIVGTDWDSDDPINGPYDGEIEECPCCNGSGKADDCTFW